MDGLLDDTERSIMDECRSNTYNSASEIKSNLIGTWNLIGHAEGWIPIYSQPCSSITFNEDELTFNYTNQFVDTTIVSTWTAIDGISGSPSLVVDKSLYDVSLNIFCEQYMFGNTLIIDGNAYLYEKVD